jgi:hypothetical protein
VAGLVIVTAGGGDHRDGECLGVRHAWRSRSPEPWASRFPPSSAARWRHPRFGPGGRVRSSPPGCARPRRTTERGGGGVASRGREVAGIQVAGVVGRGHLRGHHAGARRWRVCAGRGHTVGVQPDSVTVAMGVCRSVTTTWQLSARKLTPQPFQPPSDLRRTTNGPPPGGEGTSTLPSTRSARL